MSVLDIIAQRGIHTGRTFRQILKVDPSYIWEDWHGKSDWLKRISKEIAAVVKADDAGR